MSEDYGTSMHWPYCRDGRCTGCLPPSRHRPWGDDVSDETTAGDRPTALTDALTLAYGMKLSQPILAAVEAAVRERVAREIETRAHGAARIIRHPGQRPLCDQPDHDDRWCGTCASMEDGMDYAARMARGGAE